METTHGEDFAALCRRAGASEIEFLPFTATITVSFPEGDWSLSEVAPPMLGQESLAVVNGAEIQALSNGQILAGKLIHRGLQALARDVFDLAVALNADETAFRQAASLCPPADAELLAQEIRGMAGKYRGTAPIAIELADTQWASLLHQAPELVADALERLA